MNTALKHTLISASFMALMIAAIPAMADDASVLCSVKSNYAGVSANYTPGVDAQGNPVTPADVNAPAPVVMPVIRIPVTVDMAQRLASVLPTGTQMESLVTLAEIHPGGRVVINGQDMTGPTTAICSNIEKQKAAALRTERKPKAKKKAAAPAPASAPEVAAQPVEPVMQEPVAEAPAEPVAPNTPSLENTEAPAAPQVLQPAAEPVPAAPEPAPMPAEPAPAPAPAPAQEATPHLEQPAEPQNLTEPAPGIPVPPPSAEPAIVPPSEESQAPRPPMDPFAPADGTVQGGAQ